MTRKKRWWRSSWVLLVVCILLGRVQATDHLHDQSAWISYYGSDLIEHGLWVYDLFTQEKYLLINNIGDQYRFSPNGRYLAFLANNQDQGKAKGNTVSLWVRDLTQGIEYAVESDFDTDSNLDAVFDWLQNGNLVVIQPTQSGDQKIKILSPTGELIWANPVGSQYICHNDQSVLLAQQSDQNLILHKLSLKIDQFIPVDHVVQKGSLSPNGTFLCYQNSQELILLHLEKGEKRSIEIGELSTVELHWSPDEAYLMYQLKKNSPQKIYELTAFNLSTGSKEFAVSSKEKILYSWSEDEDQMAIGLFKDTWNLFVWFPNRRQTITIQHRMSQAPLPKYREGTHQFIYLNYVDGSPVVQNYDVDQNIFQVIHSGKEGALWSKLDWVSLNSVDTNLRNSQKNTMYWAGWSEPVEKIYISPITVLSSQKITSGQQIQRYHQRLKWAPKERLLLLQEDNETYALIDELVEKKVIYQGNQFGEPFWSQDGSMIGFVHHNDVKELVFYNVFHDLTFSYPIAQKMRLVGWMENHFWFYDEQLTGYDHLVGRWKNFDEWKISWPEPKIIPAHYLPQVLWQLGNNVWLTKEESKFRVITRLSEYDPDGWQVKENHSACWSPNDEKIVYQRFLVRDYGGEAPEEKWEIWMMDHEGQQNRYICDGMNPQWLSNHQIVFLKDGDLYSANLITGQIVGYNSPDLWEQAFMISYDGCIIAVVALDVEERAGVYFYRL